MTWPRSSHDSSPTCLPSVADHQRPGRFRCPFRALNRRDGCMSVSRTRAASASGTACSVPSMATHPERRAVLLIIRRSWVRAPPAPPHLTSEKFQIAWLPGLACTGFSGSRTGWGLAGFQRGRVQPQFAALDADQRSVVINNKDTHDERHCDRRTALTRMSCPDASTRWWTRALDELRVTWQLALRLPWRS